MCKNIAIAKNVISVNLSRCIIAKTVKISHAKK